jgi:hypothetical protein
LTEALNLEIDYNLRVKESILTVVKGTRLITLKKTPELESIALARSIKDGQTKLLKRLSFINKEDN